MTAEERTQLSRDSIAPVDHRPEDVKQESLYFRAIGHVIHLVTIEIIQVYPGAVPFSRVALIPLRRAQVSKTNDAVARAVPRRFGITPCYV